MICILFVLEYVRLSLEGETERLDGCTDEADEYTNLWLCCQSHRSLPKERIESCGPLHLLAATSGLIGPYYRGRSGPEGRLDGCIGC